ncbi:hypothetical protein FIU87_20295 [Bacillus sp. THAF10]|uniref:YwdI family protein n=1 Tax=Bacillus sp. THAF10 TaxID=2587848 RepID=UPI0012697EA7|nr:YwdI family protein [Bacillus sp. THAF10]QFT90993.1 hypothetical protein FIU87_20295 [Bacillus sp. THAF10]
MSITLNKVLERLEAELERAIDTNNVGKKREHLAAIKSLCELALDSEAEAGEGRAQARPLKPSSYTAPSPQYAVPNQSPQVANPPTKKVDVEDANGDSLFDF